MSLASLDMRNCGKRKPYFCSNGLVLMRFHCLPVDVCLSDCVCTPPPSPSLSFPLSLVFFSLLSLSFSLTLTHSLPLFLTLSLSLSQSLSLSLSLSISLQLTSEHSDLQREYIKLEARIKAKMDRIDLLENALKNIKRDHQEKRKQ